MAQRALIMLLRRLPSQGAHFKIFSFGEQRVSTWLHRVPCNEKTLKVAVSEVLLIGPACILTARRRCVLVQWLLNGGTEV